MATRTAPNPRTDSSWRPSADKILEAAEATFAQHGYAETSLRQLMTAAAVSTTAFYARFPSKEAVLVALVKRVLERLYQSATQSLGKAATLEEGFELGVDVLVRVLSEHQVSVRLALTDASCSPSALVVLHQAYAALAQMIGHRLRRLVERGEADVVDPEALGWALVGALKIQIMRWAVFGEIDRTQLAHELRATARTMLPAVVKKRPKTR